MPTIKFKLKDPKYCNGCPCLYESIDSHGNYYAVCPVFDDTTERGSENLFRPSACIDKFGE
jgi:hypothetical protein